MVWKTLKVIEIQKHSSQTSRDNSQRIAFFPQGNLDKVTAVTITIPYPLGWFSQTLGEFFDSSLRLLFLHFLGDYIVNEYIGRGQIVPYGTKPNNTMQTGQV